MRNYGGKIAPALLIPGPDNREIILPSKQVVTSNYAPTVDNVGTLPSFSDSPFLVRDSTYTLSSSNFASMEIQFFPSNFPTTSFRRRIGGIFSELVGGIDASLPLQWKEFGSTSGDEIRVIEEVDTPVPIPFQVVPFPNGPDGDGWYPIHNNTALWRIGNQGGPIGTISKEITFEIRDITGGPVTARFRKTLELTRTP